MNIRLTKTWLSKKILLTRLGIPLAMIARIRYMWVRPSGLQLMMWFIDNHYRTEMKLEIKKKNETKEKNSEVDTPYLSSAPPFSAVMM